MKTIEKVLTLNDTGETGSHQCGIAIPSNPLFIDFFPPLPKGRNPSEIIYFEDPHGVLWPFRYVYYNNKLYGGTRNERRLSRTHKYLNAAKASAGDTLVLSHDPQNGYKASIRSQLEPNSEFPIQQQAMPSVGCMPQTQHRLVCTQGKWKLVTTLDKD